MRFETIRLLVRSQVVSAVFLSTTVFVAAATFVACSNGNPPPAGGNGSGMATVSISDPATCAGPNGPFAHVYVTITDVQANTNAGENDSGWTDLTPSLPPQPRQIDLLGHANNQCFLATLGDAQQLQAGNYQQIRLMLADNSTQVPNSMCGGSANCVVLASDGSVHPLLLSSESKTGLKVPSGQIAGGAFTIEEGRTEDLDIDFDTCASIVQESNGQFRLKPVLHAGEVSTTSTSINGSILDHETGNPVNGLVLVALEQKDASGIDRIVMSTMAKADGSFVFCPVPAGSYDLVIVADQADGTAYVPAIVTAVSNGETVGSIGVSPGVTGIQGAASFSGSVTSQNSAHAVTTADLQLSALETVGSNGAFTIPLLPDAQQPSATLAVETAVSPTCPQGSACVSYSMLLPASGSYIGTYSANGITLLQSSPSGTYVIDGLAFAPGSGGATDCVPAEQKSPSYALTSSFNVSVQPLAFVQCQ